MHYTKLVLIASYVHTYIATIYNTDIREDIGARHQRHEFDEVVTRKHFITRQDCRNAYRKTRDYKSSTCQ